MDSLNWFASFQVSILEKRKRRDAVDKTFIAKLQREMVESRYVVQQYFSGVTEFE